MNRSGNVVGLASGKAIQATDTTSKTTENINLAVSLGTIESFLDSHAVPYTENERTESKKYTDILADLMSYTVLLECAD